MLNLNEIYDEAMLCESSDRIFDSGDITFADMRDIFQKLFGTGITFSGKVSRIPLLITHKDGNFCIANCDKNINDPCKYEEIDLEKCNIPDGLDDSVKNTLGDLAIALSEIDEVALNRYFANGRNFLDCSIICPPAACAQDYCCKCPVSFNSIRCYDDKFKEIGTDDESSKQLFDILRANAAMQSETAELPDNCVQRLRKLSSTRQVLAKLMEKLGEFIDGVGWKCSLNQYIQDRYSRHIVNKALEHGIDVSRTSDFVNALASRLAQVSCKKPTKSDLITYAKCDGVNYRDPEYKAFIQELEDNCDSTNAEIIKPIEDIIKEACDTAIQNIVGYMSADPSKMAKKVYSQLQDIGAKINEEDETEDPAEKRRLAKDRMQKFRKTLAKLDEYCEGMSQDGIVFMYRQKPYRMTGNFVGLEPLLGIIKYK